MSRLVEYPNLQAMMQGCVSGQSTEWPLLRAELCRLLATHDADIASLSEKPATNQEFHQWLESYKPGVVFDHGDMAACWHAAQRSSAK
jgi:hypothetical protein